MRTASASVVDNAKSRKDDLAAIHIAKKDLRWDDDHYRDILWTVCNVRSSGDLDFTGRKRFLDHLRKCGWTNARAPSSAARKARPWTPQQRKVWSLWQQLADKGLVAARDRRALDAWIQRHSPTAVAALEFLNQHQLDLVVEMLKKWLERGVAP